MSRRGWLALCVLLLFFAALVEWALTRDVDAGRAREGAAPRAPLVTRHSVIAALPPPREVTAESSRLPVPVDAGVERPIVATSSAVVDSGVEAGPEAAAAEAARHGRNQRRFVRGIQASGKGILDCNQQWLQQNPSLAGPLNLSLVITADDAGVPTVSLADVGEPADAGFGFALMRGCALNVLQQTVQSVEFEQQPGGLNLRMRIRFDAPPGAEWVAE